MDKQAATLTMIVINTALCTALSFSADSMRNMEPKWFEAITPQESGSLYEDVAGWSAILQTIAGLVAYLLFGMTALAVIRGFQKLTQTSTTPLESHQVPEKLSSAAIKEVVEQIAATSLAQHLRNGEELVNDVDGPEDKFITAVSRLVLSNATSNLESGEKIARSRVEALN